MLLKAASRFANVLRLSKLNKQENGQMSTALRFVIDFDETLTATDTTSLIASLNTKNNSQWKVFEKKYLDEFTKQSSLALTRALSNKSMMNYFNDMAAFESRSIKETIDGRYLQDITTAQLKDLAKNIKPKEGMHEAVTKLLEISGANPIHVLSLSWSKLVIKEFLSIQFPAHSSHFVVHANDLEADGNGISSGNITHGIHSAQDKAVQVRQLRAEMDSRNESANLVCIGDSLNDLLALLSADYGILLGSFDNNSKLVQLCALEHISLESITKLDLAIKQDKTVFVAYNWKQITEALDIARKNA